MCSLLEGTHHLRVPADYTLRRKNIQKRSNLISLKYDILPFEVTALMGAHSLGMCHEEKTGYNGPWTPEDLKGFNNEFYQNLVNSTFTFRNRVSRRIF